MRFRELIEEMRNSLEHTHESLVDDSTAGWRKSGG
jgi:hypothetical protein